MSNQLLQNAIILDTETLGLTRGAGMHELATLDLSTGELHELIISPNRVSINASPQEHTKLASSGADVYTRHTAGDWPEIIRQQLSEKLGRPVLRHEVKGLLAEEEPWLLRQMRKHPHLQGKQPLGPRGLLAGHTTHQVDMDTALQFLREKITGRTVWIANAQFEAKAIGAQLAASPVHDSTDWKSTFETFNPNNPEPFHVTGKAVTSARALAQQTGDWTGVWRAMVAHQPVAGETVVRDIQDVTRAVHSYGRKLGLTTLDAQYLGTGVDISNRLTSLAFGLTPEREAHRAAEDTIHEAGLLYKQIALAETLEAASQGHKVDLETAARYFQLLEAYRPALLQEQLVKRLGRAAKDIRLQGYTSQRTGGSPYQIEAVTPQGVGTTTTAMSHHRVRYQNMEQVLQALETEGRYAGSTEAPRAIWERMRQVPEKQLESWIVDETARIQSTWDHVRVQFDPSRANIHGGRYSDIGRVIGDIPTKGKYVAAAAGVVAALGAVGTFFDRGNRPDPVRDNVLSYGYDQWVEQQRQHGLSEGRVAKQKRRATTDFGSPYRGPIGVEQVFIDQQLLNERERLLRIKYGQDSAAAFSPWSAPGSEFKHPLAAHNQYLGGERYQAGRLGLRGRGLRTINIADGYRIEAEDADTVTVTKTGFMASVRSYFGLERKYSFRLAGIDSTETSHGERSYHAPQPHAEAAAAALRQMIAQSDTQELVFDPKQTTYGRGLAALVLDGKNTNFELVRRGLAAHLPYGKYKDSMIDYGALAAAEEQAAKANRGMWGHGWAQAFRAHSEASGNRITFNTLTNISKIAENQGTMKLLSAMEAAQTNQNMVQTAAMMGSSYQVGSDIFGPGQFDHANAPSSSYLTEQQADLGRWIKTSGRGGISNRLSHKHGRSALDSTLAAGTLAGSNIHTRRRYAAFDQYQTRKHLGRIRAQRQAAAQKAALQRMQASPIGHHWMA